MRVRVSLTAPETVILVLISFFLFCKHRIFAQRPHVKLCSYCDQSGLNKGSNTESSCDHSKTLYLVRSLQSLTSNSGNHFELLLDNFLGTCFSSVRRYFTVQGLYNLTFRQLKEIFLKNFKNFPAKSIFILAKTQRKLRCRIRVK